MSLEQFYLACLAHASYLVGDEAARAAVVVDPQRDVRQYLQLASALLRDFRPRRYELPAAQEALESHEVAFARDQGHARFATGGREQSAVTPPDSAPLKARPH